MAATGTSYQFNGIDGGDQSGISVSSAGDVDGDGLDDLIIGAVGADPNGNGFAGESYLILAADLVALDDATVNGGAVGDGIIELEDVAAIGGSYQFNGIDGNDFSGTSVSSAGDVDGDGLDDLIIGARNADPNGNGGAGESYLILGGRSGGARHGLGRHRHRRGRHYRPGRCGGDRRVVSVQRDRYG